MRQDGGRPSAGMRPAVISPDGGRLDEAITVLIVPRDPAESTGLFRHQVRRTHDPALRHQRALEILSATFYQHPESFSDVLTALFATDSSLAATLTVAGRCVLEFSQFSQAYRMACAVGTAAAGDPIYEATYWHNALFNPSLPGAVSVLTFSPDWSEVRADPPVM